MPGYRCTNSILKPLLVIQNTEITGYTKNSNTIISIYRILVHILEPGYSEAVVVGVGRQGGGGAGWTTGGADR